MSLGITVHGLKEKLTYLEGLHEENLRKDIQVLQDKENQRKLEDAAEAERN